MDDKENSDVVENILIPEMLSYVAKSSRSNNAEILKNLKTLKVLIQSIQLKNYIAYKTIATILYNEFLDLSSHALKDWNTEITLEVLKTMSALHSHLDSNSRRIIYSKNHLNILALSTYACTEILLKCKNTELKYASLECIDSIFRINDPETMGRDILFHITPKVFIAISKQFTSKQPYTSDQLAQRSTTTFVNLLVLFFSDTKTTTNLIFFKWQAGARNEVQPYVESLKLLILELDNPILRDTLTSCCILVLHPNSTIFLEQLQVFVELYLVLNFHDMQQGDERIKLFLQNFDLLPHFKKLIQSFIKEIHVMRQDSILINFWTLNAYLNHFDRHNITILKRPDIRKSLLDVILIILKHDYGPHLLREENQQFLEFKYFNGKKHIEAVQSMCKLFARKKLFLMFSNDLLNQLNSNDSNQVMQLLVFICSCQNNELSQEETSCFLDEALQDKHWFLRTQSFNHIESANVQEVYFNIVHTCLTIEMSIMLLDLQSTNKKFRMALDILQLLSKSQNNGNYLIRTATVHGIRHLISYLSGADVPSTEILDMKISKSLAKIQSTYNVRVAEEYLKHTSKNQEMRLQILENYTVFIYGLNEESRLSVLKTILSSLRDMTRPIDTNAADISSCRVSDKWVATLLNKTNAHINQDISEKRAQVPEDGVLQTIASNIVDLLSSKIIEQICLVLSIIKESISLMSDEHKITIMHHRIWKYIQMIIRHHGSNSPVFNCLLDLFGVLSEKTHESFQLKFWNEIVPILLNNETFFSVADKHDKAYSNNTHQTKSLVLLVNILAALINDCDTKEPEINNILDWLNLDKNVHTLECISYKPVIINSIGYCCSSVKYIDDVFN